MHKLITNFCTQLWMHTHGRQMDYCVCLQGVCASHPLSRIRLSFTSTSQVTVGQQTVTIKPIRRSTSHLPMSHPLLIPLSQSFNLVTFFFVQMRANKVCGTFCMQWNGAKRWESHTCCPPRVSGLHEGPGHSRALLSLRPSLCWRRPAGRVFFSWRQKPKHYSGRRVARRGVR